ncbi:MAG TPA: hypothetical protein VEZ55_13830 [Chitinophagaceae bacterium]|nr:hypothetical protein [Chitinophagaceae bacterium]
MSKVENASTAVSQMVHERPGEEPFNFQELSFNKVSTCVGGIRPSLNRPLWCHLRLVYQGRIPKQPEQ